MRALNALRQHAVTIFQAGLKAVDPAEAVKRHVKRQGDVIEVCGYRYPLLKYPHAYIVGAGKASARMAHTVKEMLGDWICGGRVVVKYGHGVPVPDVEIIEAGHPVPDDNGVRGTASIIQMLEGAEREDLILCLLSGGGSALLCCPARGLTLQDKQVTTQLLLNCGVDIQEINAIRKHLSDIKGGRLVRFAYPATVVSLILSDVIGDPIESIASGPTAPDPSTFGDCLRIVERYGLQHQIPPNVRLYLEKGARGEIDETPKPQDSLFAGVRNVIVGSNRLAMEAAKRKAEDLGYHSLILSGFIEGETRLVATLHTAIAREINGSGNPVPRPACVISGGETTVTLRGQGRGGRNQEFALAAALEIEGLPRVVVLSGGTDGTDGPTDAAGAIADSSTLQRAKSQGLDAEQFLSRNDSYNFFKPLGDLLVTGPTLTNVMDLRLMLLG
jgi:glycerate 2-kinase